MECVTAFNCKGSGQALCGGWPWSRGARKHQMFCGTCGLQAEQLTFGATPQADMAMCPGTYPSRCRETPLAEPQARAFLFTGSCNGTLTEALTVPCAVTPARPKHQDQPLYSVERFDLYLGCWEAGGNDGVDRRYTGCQCFPDSGEAL